MRLAGLFTDEGTYTDLAIGRTFIGPAEIAGFKMLADSMIADIHIEVLNAFGAQDSVAIESVYSGRYNAAPRAFTVRGTTILRLDGRLIASNTDNYSLSTVLGQSGLPADWTPDPISTPRSSA